MRKMKGLHSFEIEPYKTSYVVDYWACGAKKCDSWHTTKARASRCPKKRKEIRELK